MAKASIPRESRYKYDDVICLVCGAVKQNYYDICTTFIGTCKVSLLIQKYAEIKADRGFICSVCLEWLRELNKHCIQFSHMCNSHNIRWAIPHKSSGQAPTMATSSRKRKAKKDVIFRQETCNSHTAIGYNTWKNKTLKPQCEGYNEHQTYYAVNYNETFTSPLLDQEPGHPGIIPDGSSLTNVDLLEVAAAQSGIAKEILDTFSEETFEVNPDCKQDSAGAQEVVMEQSCDYVALTYNFPDVVFIRNTEQLNVPLKGVWQQHDDSGVCQDSATPAHHSGQLIQPFCGILQQDVYTTNELDNQIEITLPAESVYGTQPVQNSGEVVGATTESNNIDDTSISEKHKLVIVTENLLEGYSNHELTLKSDTEQLRARRAVISNKFENERKQSKLGQKLEYERINTAQGIPDGRLSNTEPVLSDMKLTNNQHASHSISNKNFLENSNGRCRLKGLCALTIKPVLVKTLGKTNNSNTLSAVPSKRSAVDFSSLENIYNAVQLQRAGPYCSDEKRVDCLSQTSSLNSEDAYYQCKKCNVNFRGWIKFMGHWITHAHVVYTVRKDESYSCNLSDTKGTYTEHLVQCNICDKIFLSAHTFQIHTVQRHKINPSTEKPQNPSPKYDTMFMCSVCKMHSWDLNNFFSHWFSHADYLITKFVPSSPNCLTAKTKVNKCPCQFCGKEFVNRTHLLSHERKHSGEKPFPCPSCPESFTLKHKLKRHHLQDHASPKEKSDNSTICEVCGEVMLLTRYWSHMNKHKDHLYKCGRCETIFKNHERLQYHLTQQKQRGICARKAMQKCSVSTDVVRDKTELTATNAHSDQCQSNVFDAVAKKWMCNVCSKTFLFQKMLDIHVRKHTS